MHTITKPRARRAPGRPPRLTRAIPDTAGMQRPPRPVGHVVQVPQETKDRITKLRDEITRAERALYDTIEAERLALRITTGAAAELLEISKPTLDRRLAARRAERQREDGGEA